MLKIYDEFQTFLTRDRVAFIRVWFRFFGRGTVPDPFFHPVLFPTFQIVQRHLAAILPVHG